MTGQVGKWMSPVLALLFGIVLLAMAHVRPMDMDEAPYLASSSLVERGELPYHDFPFWQTPGSLYFSALWSQVPLSRTLAHARVPYVFCAVGLLLLFRKTARRVCFDPAVVTLASILLIGNEIVLAWSPVVKTHAPTALLMMTGMFLLFRAQEEGRGRVWWGLAGLAWAGAVDFRLMILPAVGVLALWIWRVNGGLAFLLFCGGIVAGLMPVWLLVFPDPEAFWFHNVGFHREARGTTLVGDPLQKGYVVLSLVSSLQTGLLLLLSVIAAVREGRGRASGPGWRHPFLPILGVLLPTAVVLLLPTPTFTQYYIVLIPFLILLALPILEVLWREHRRWVLLAVGVYLLSSPPYLRHEWTKWSYGTSPRTGDFEQVRRVVEENSRPEETILDGLGIWLWMTERPGYPQAAGWTSLQTGRVLPPERARRFHAPPIDELLEDLRQGRIPLVIWSASHVFREREEEVRAVILDRYREVFTSAWVSVYRVK